MADVKWINQAAVVYVSRKAEELDPYYDYCVAVW